MLQNWIKSIALRRTRQQETPPTYKRPEVGHVSWDRTGMYRWDGERWQKQTINKEVLALRNLHPSSYRRG